MVAVLALAFVATIYVRSRIDSVDAGNVNDDWSDHGVGHDGPAPMPVLEDVS